MESANLLESSLYCCCRCKGLFSLHDDKLKHQMNCIGNPMETTCTYFACERKVFLQLYQPDDFLLDGSDPPFWLSKDDSFINHFVKVRVPDIFDPSIFLKNTSQHNPVEADDTNFLLESNINTLEEATDKANNDGFLDANKTVDPSEHEQIQNIINKNIEYLKNDDIATLSTVTSKSSLPFTQNSGLPRLLSPIDKHLHLFGEGSKSRLHSPFERGSGFLPDGSGNFMYSSNPSLPFSCGLSTDLFSSLPTTQDDNQQGFPTNIEEFPTLKYLDLAKKDPFLGQNPGLSQMNTKDPFLINAAFKTSDRPNVGLQKSQITRSCEDLQTSPTVPMQDGNYFNFPSTLDEPTQLDYLDLATLDFLTNPNFIIYGTGVVKDKLTEKDEDIYSEGYLTDAEHRCGRSEMTARLGGLSVDDTSEKGHMSAFSKVKKKKIRLKKTKSDVGKKHANATSNHRSFFAGFPNIRDDFQSSVMKSDDDIISVHPKGSRSLMEASDFRISRKRKTDSSKENNKEVKLMKMNRRSSETRRVSRSEKSFNIQESLPFFSEEQKDTFNSVIGQSGCIFVKKKRSLSCDEPVVFVNSQLFDDTDIFRVHKKLDECSHNFQALTCDSKSKLHEHKSKGKLTSVLQLKCIECNFLCKSVIELKNHRAAHTLNENRPEISGDDIQAVRSRSKNNSGNSTSTETSDVLSNGDVYFNTQDHALEKIGNAVILQNPITRSESVFDNGVIIHEATQEFVANQPKTVSLLSKSLNNNTTNIEDILTVDKPEQSCSTEFITPVYPEVRDEVEQAVMAIEELNTRYEADAKNLLRQEENCANDVNETGRLDVADNEPKAVMENRLCSLNFEDKHEHFAVPTVVKDYSYGMVVENERAPVFVMSNNQAQVVYDQEKLTNDGICGDAKLPDFDYVVQDELGYKDTDSRKLQSESTEVNTEGHVIGSENYTNISVCGVELNSSLTLTDMTSEHLLVATELQSRNETGHLCAGSRNEESENQDVSIVCFQSSPGYIQTSPEYSPEDFVDQVYQDTEKTHSNTGNRCLELMKEENKHLAMLEHDYSAPAPISSLVSYTDQESQTNIDNEEIHNLSGFEGSSTDFHSVRIAQTNIGCQNFEVSSQSEIKTDLSSSSVTGKGQRDVRGNPVTSDMFIPNQDEENSTSKSDDDGPGVVESFIVEEVVQTDDSREIEGVFHNEAPDSLQGTSSLRSNFNTSDTPNTSNQTTVFANTLATREVIASLTSNVPSQVAVMQFTHIQNCTGTYYENGKVGNENVRNITEVETVPKTTEIYSTCGNTEGKDALEQGKEQAARLVCTASAGMIDFNLKASTAFSDSVPIFASSNCETSPEKFTRMQSLLDKRLVQSTKVFGKNEFGTETTYTIQVPQTQDHQYVRCSAVPASLVSSTESGNCVSVQDKESDSDKVTPQQLNGGSTSSGSPGEVPKDMVKHSDGLYHCPMQGCQFKTVYKWNVPAHYEQVHLALKKYTCDKCTYSTASMCPQEPEIVSKQNQICQKNAHYTLQTSSLKHHLQLYHYKDKRFKCPDCNYLSMFHSDVVKHVRHTHRKQKQFACDQCDYRTGHSHSIKLHFMSHNGIRPFKCSSCDYRANNSNKVTRHISLCHKDLEGVVCEKLDVDLNIDIKQFQCEELISQDEINVIKLTEEEANVIMMAENKKKEKMKKNHNRHGKGGRKLMAEKNKSEKDLPDKNLVSNVGTTSNSAKVITLTPEVAKALMEAKSETKSAGKGKTEFTKVLTKSKTASNNCRKDSNESIEILGKKLNMAKKHAELDRNGISTLQPFIVKTESSDVVKNCNRNK